MDQPGAPVRQASSAFLTKTHRVAHEMSRLGSMKEENYETVKKSVLTLQLQHHRPRVKLWSWIKDHTDH